MHEKVSLGSLWILPKKTTTRGKGVLVERTWKWNPRCPGVMGGGMSNDQNRRAVVHIKEVEASDLH